MQFKIKEWLTGMNVKTLPNNYKLFSKVEKSMTKATKIKTNLYGHPSGNYFETPPEAKVHINYLLGKSKVCHCIYCKPSNALYIKQKNKRKFDEEEEESEKYLIKNSKLPLKKAWNHYKNRQSAITVESKAEEWKWYNGYRENEIIWAPMIEDENHPSHSIFWTFQIVKRLSNMELADPSAFNKLVSFEKVIKYVSKTIIKPSTKVNLNDILKEVKTEDINSNANGNTNDDNNNTNIWNKSDNLLNNIFGSSNTSPHHEDNTTEQVKDSNEIESPSKTATTTTKEIDPELQKTLDRKKKDKENLMTLLSGTYDDEEDDDDEDADFVLSDEGDDDYYTDDSEDLIRKPPSDSGSEVSVGSVLNDTQNNSVQQVESLGYICRQLPLQNISIEQEEEEEEEEEERNGKKKKAKSTYTYYFIPFKIIIPFLMYDPCSKNNILWNRAVMQAIDLSSSFSIPIRKDTTSPSSSTSPSNPNASGSANANTPLHFPPALLHQKETRTPLEYFRFGAEQLYVGDILRLDLSNNSATRWIKTVNQYERVDKHEYLEVNKIVEIRTKGKSMATIEITGKIYFNVFADKTDHDHDSSYPPLLSTKNTTHSPISSPSHPTSTSVVAHTHTSTSTSPNTHTHTHAHAHVPTHPHPHPHSHSHPHTHSSGLKSATTLSQLSMSTSSSISSLFIPEFSDILWVYSGEERTVRLEEICGRYYVNCPTLERKMRISSEKAWDKDTSVFGSSKQELAILEYENRMRHNGTVHPLKA